jgi:LysM repeat protein
MIGSRIIWLTLLLLPAGASLRAQRAAAPKPPIPTVEAGLENAVKWKWSVEKAEGKGWGFVLDSPESKAAAGGDPSRPGQPAAPAPPPGPPEQPLDHIVSRGEALVIIARKYQMQVDHIKKANDLTGDLIRIGQVLKIPSRDEIKAMEPPPPPKPTVTVTTGEGGGDKADAEKTSGDAARAAPVKPRYTRPLPAEAIRFGHIVLTQSFLDRQMFSAGPIDGGAGPMYESTLRAYKESHPGILDYENGETPKALVDMAGSYREYILRREDFQWIDTRFSPSPASRGSRAPAVTPDPTWDDLTSNPFLAYRSVWEFVAERYHCSESFLRRINTGLRSPETPGAVFLVPNVEPFEIERVFEAPLQPEAVEGEAVTATIVNLTWLEVRRSGQLVARVPVSVARPGLRGRGVWRVLDVMGPPKLVSLGEWNTPPRNIGDPEGEVVELKPPAGLVIGPGPNNPLGPLWLNLARGNETEPLPYGLHGTSIPGLMSRQESLGGFRLANWDISRIVRLLPPGTELRWE